MFVASKRLHFVLVLPTKNTILNFFRKVATNNIITLAQTYAKFFTWQNLF